MGKKRILIADDSELIRTLITQALNKEDEIEVVGVASNGKEALDLLDDCKPNPWSSWTYRCRSWTDFRPWRR